MRIARRRVDRLDRSHLVEGEACSARRSARPGLDREPRDGDAVGAALRSTILAMPAARSPGRLRVVLRRVGDAEAAAQVQLGQLDTELGADLASCRPRMRRADTSKPACRRSASRCGGAARAAGGSRGGRGSGARPRGRAPRRGTAELLVLVGGRDELVGVRLDPDRDADQHRGDDTRARRRRRTRARSPRTSRRRSTPTPTPAPCAISARDLLLPCTPMGSPGTPARMATASSPPVHTSRRRPSSRDPAGDRGAQEGLAGVVHVGAAAEVVEHLVVRRRHRGRERKSASSRT